MPPQTIIWGTEGVGEAGGTQAELGPALFHHVWDLSELQHHSLHQAGTPKALKVSLRSVFLRTSPASYPTGKLLFKSHPSKDGWGTGQLSTPRLSTQLLQKAHPSSA